MAIEFRCPYCTATIRVADSAPGRMGKCPKCNTKMIVPRPSASLLMSLPPNLGDTQAVPTPAEEEPVLLEEHDTATPDVHFASTDAPAIVPPAAPMEPPPVALPTNLSPVIAPLQRGQRLVRKRPAGRRKRPQVMWIIASLMGLGLSIAAGYVVWREAFNGRLDGELIGAALDEPKLAPATVPRESLGMIASALDPVLADLEAQPVPLVSELMDIKIGGSKDGLVITIEPGARTQWYRVDAKSHPQLAKFAADRAKSLDEPRVKELAQAAPAFVRDYQKVRSREEDSSVMTPYRDTLALNALVQGLGKHTAAVVGRTVYPCVYEQTDGSLYFLLPAKLKSFTLQGKGVAEGKPGLFRGEFRVVVKPDRSPPPEPTPMESKTTEKAIEKEPEAMEAPADETEEVPATPKKKKRAKP